MLFHSQELQVIVIFKRRFYLLFLCFYVIFIKLLCNFLIFFEKSIALTLKLLYNQFVFDFRDGFAQLAQSVEHVTVNHRVVGSSPTLSAIIVGPLVKWFNTHAFHACIHGFKSRTGHQLDNK